MKKLFYSVLSCITFLSTAIATAQNDNSLLWKISGNGLEQPSYVFGTIHMICEDDYFLNPEVEKALNDSKALITEINFGDMSEMMQMQKLVQSDISLKERLKANQYKKLEQLLKDKLNIEIANLDKVSESGIASLVTMQSFGCPNIKMYEVELLQKAMANQKALNGLETIDEQMKVLEDHMDIEATIKMLEEIGTDADTTNEMVDLYKQQKIDALLDLMQKASYMSSKAYDEFVVNRNNNWISKMPELMQKQPSFFAVGAAHLGSKDGVLELLRKKGYRVEALN